MDSQTDPISKVQKLSAGTMAISTVTPQTTASHSPITPGVCPPSSEHQKGAHQPIVAVNSMPTTPPVVCKSKSTCMLQCDAPSYWTTLTTTTLVWAAWGGYFG